MYFIGQTRFSLYIPKSKAWNVSNFTEEEYIAHLFSDDRMSVRAKIFAEISVPLMAEMKKHFDFRHIVSYSSILPEKWKVILFELAKKYPFLYLCEVDSHDENPVSSVLKGKPDGSVAFYRLDDDDLLAVDYLDNLAKYNKPAYKNMAVSFGKGIIGLYENNGYSDFRDAVQKYPSMGQAYIGFWQNGSLELPPLYSHHDLDQNIPVIVDSMNVMYLQTYHQQQDTNYRFSNDSKKQTDNIKNDLVRFSKVKSPEVICKSFPLLVDDVQNFLVNRTTVFKVENKTLSEKSNKLKIDSQDAEKVFECEYEIRTDKNVTSSKGFVLSVFSNDSSESIHGLTRSGNPDIGWYKYLSVSDGVAKGSFSFSVDSPTQLKEIRIIFWDNRITSAEIKKIDVSY